MNRETFLTLLTKKLAGELSDEEKRQLDSALEANKEYHQIYNGILIHARASEIKLNPEKALATVWNKMGTHPGLNHKRQIPPYRYLPWMAASILIVVMGYWLISKNIFSVDNEGMITLYTKNEKLDTVLKDGTRVILHENSQLSLSKNFGSQSMSVILKGYAFFDVTKKTSIPMIVQADPVNIVIKGTAFYVNNSSSNVEVKLLRGLVEVRSRHDSSDKVLLKPNQTLSVAESGDHHLQYTVSNLPILDLANITSNGDTLVFNNKRLDLLVPLLEKKYNTRIEIRNETLRAKRFTGRFVTETLQEALEALQFTYPFSYNTVDKTIILE